MNILVLEDSLNNERWLKMTLSGENQSKRLAGNLKNIYKSSGYSVSSFNGNYSLRSGMARCIAGISIWRKGSSLVSMLYPAPYLYFSIEDHHDGRLMRFNQEQIKTTLLGMNRDALTALKSNIQNFKYGRTILFFSVMRRLSKVQKDREQSF